MYIYILVLVWGFGLHHKKFPFTTVYPTKTLEFSHEKFEPHEFWPNRKVVPGGRQCDVETLTHPVDGWRQVLPKHRQVEVGEKKHIASKGKYT